MADKITMNMISDEIKQMARQAAENNNFNEMASQIRDALKEQFPSASPRETKNALRALRGISAMPAGQEMRESETQEEIADEKRFNKQLRASFTYKSRPLNYDNLNEGNFNVESLAFKKTSAPSDIGQTLTELEEFAKKTNDETVINNVNKLMQYHRDLQQAEGKQRSSRKTRIDVAWAEDIGDLKLGKLSSRERIYDYWEGIHGKHKTLLDAAKEFHDMLVSLDFVMEETESKFLKPFIDASNNFIADYKKGIPNYVLKLKPFELPVDNAFNNALYIMDAFNDLRGAVPQKKAPEDMGMQDERGYQPDEVSEGAAQTGSEALESDRQQGEVQTVYDASLPDMSGRAKEPQVVTSKNLMNVDPIFWYKFKDDFSKIRIPKRQLNQVKAIINGVREKRLEPIEEGGEIRVIPATIGLKYRFMGKRQGEEYILDKQALNEFDDWFNKFEANIDDIQDEKIFHLPLSKFVEKYQKKGETNYDKITDDTVRFLDNIANIAEAYKTSLSVYQPKKGEGTQGETGSAPMSVWAGQKGKEREVPALVDKPWNDLLKAINEYYLIPLQGRNYVQAKEKPTWATGHSAMVLSIKNAKENAIGAMLDRMVTDSIHLVSPKNIKDITAFIQSARQTGARAFTKEIFRTGKKAVTALNRLFGKNYETMNKRSVGFIIYDMARKLNVQNLGDLSTPYWSNLKELHDEYKDSNKDKYPITMLRYALNTPEFKAWLGLKDNIDFESKKVNYTDPKLAEAIDELDKVFDSFHKMDSVNLSLLNAHDTIRKMQDKDISYANLSLDSVEHMDLVINKIHTEQRMDVTATEINRIVKAVASYESISRDYGINEDTVYTIKALFR